MTSERIVAGTQSLAVVAITTTVAALLQYGLILPSLDATAPKLVLVLAILASAAYRGLWTGLLATALALLIALDASFQSGAPVLTLPTTVPLLLLAIVGVVASALAEELHRARRRVERRQLALQKTKSPSATTECRRFRWRSNFGPTCCCSMSACRR